MASKTCEMDVIPTKLLKLLLGDLIKVITDIVNLSLESGFFHSDWKTAIVRPLLKKSGLDLVPSNYRPVSNLTFISKVVEKCMLQQFSEHLNKYNLLPNYQSAYRKNYSCETALIKLFDDLLWAMEKQQVTAVVAIDLSAAFDTIDHDILLKVLNSRFGIDGKALEWYASYLSPRHLKVNIGQDYSTVRDLNFSVPQGSCSGPILYSCYAASMELVVDKSINIHGYADDHALKKAFSITSTTAENKAINLLENNAIQIKTWMDMNRLQMNPTKTEFIIIGSRQHLKKLSTSVININDNCITKSKSIKYLGVDIDENLNLKSHITRKCRIAMGNFHKLKRIRRVLTRDAAITVALGLVVAHLDYANAVFIGLPDVEFAKLQRIQNMTAKLVTGASKYDSSTQALKELHWLPVKLRVLYKILTVVFRCLEGNAPDYLTCLIKERSIRRQGLRSNDEPRLLCVPFVKRHTFAARAFSVVGPTEWNNLPDYLRVNMEYPRFKKLLKTYLFGCF